MKKANYLIVVVLALVTVFTSCEKDEILTPEQPTGITADQLYGDWIFYSLEIDGEIYYNNDKDIDAISDKYRSGAYSFLNLVENTEPEYKFDGYLDMVLHCERSEWNQVFTVENNQFIVGDYQFFYEIMNVESFNGTELILKAYGGKPLVGSILTLRFGN